jgi:hypothetical protein
VRTAGARVIFEKTVFFVHLYVLTIGRAPSRRAWVLDHWTFHAHSRNWCSVAFCIISLEHRGLGWFFERAVVVLWWLRQSCFDRRGAQGKKLLDGLGSSRESTGILQALFHFCRSFHTDFLNANTSKKKNDHRRQTVPMVFTVGSQG